MFGFIHIASFDGVVVYVIYLFNHHLFCLYICLYPVGISFIYLLYVHMRSQAGAWERGKTRKFTAVDIVVPPGNVTILT